MPIKAMQIPRLMAIVTTTAEQLQKIAVLILLIINTQRNTMDILIPMAAIKLISLKGKALLIILPLGRS